ncbi:MAG: sulfatase-like hydrolase/transferase [Rikenellaceae bacterium]
MNLKFIPTLLSVGVSFSAVCGTATKPNILWIITDDQRADALECWNRATRGSSESALGYVSSPNIDKLASEGVLFTNSFCNSPVSAPSRASMHTGRYPHHNGIYDFSLTHNTNDFARPLLPQVMQKQGYKTTLFGKMGVRIFKYQEPLRFVDDPTIYNEKVSMESDLERKGITDWCKMSVYGKDEVHGTKEFWYYPDGSSVSYYLERKGAELTQEDKDTAAKFREKHKVITMPNNAYGAVISGESPMPTELTLDGRIAHEFMSYISNTDKSYNILNGRKIEGPKSGQPQFIQLGFHFPHTAVMPSKEYRDKFLNRKYNIPEFDKEEELKMPKQLAGWRRINDITSLTDEQKEQFIRDYYAFCAMGDKLIGEAVDKFKSYCKECDEPYIIVIACGDHGWHLGEQGVTCKASNYIKSNQTAVIAISSDKSLFPAGKVVNDFVEYVDFAPTFITAAGEDVSKPEFDYLDGRDLVKTANGAIQPRDYVLGETSVSGGNRAYLRAKDFAFSMRNRKPIPWKMKQKVETRPNADIKWALECTPEEADMALFDLRVDPLERNNVAYDKEYTELAQWLRKKLGNIVLGDNRLECNWGVKNDYNISSFAVGSDDKKLDMPSSIIPKI